MRIGIIGCGKIARKHINFIKKYKKVEIVGLVDKDENQAVNLAKSFQLGRVYTDIKAMLEEQNPDVVHILTPPQSHAQLAKHAIQYGCHVFIEKPMVLNISEAEDVLEMAQKKGVKICVNHNHLFDPPMQKVKELIQKKEAGKLIFLESHYGFNIGGANGPYLSREHGIHWAYGLPGGIFHNLIDHPLCLLIRYIGQPIDISVVSKSTGLLPEDLADELRILINGQDCMALATISFNTRPSFHHLNVYGSKMFLSANFDNMSFTKLPHRALPKALTKALVNLDLSFQLTRNTITNTSKFLSGKVESYEGMKILIHTFYKSIENNTEVPIKPDHILSLIKITDEIWKKVKNVNPEFHDRFYPPKYLKDQKKPRILITGASGFLGSRLTERLISEGFPVRALVRKLSKTNSLKPLDTEICYGDLRDKESLKKALKDIDIVIHAGAATSGSRDAYQGSTISGTENILEMCYMNGNIKKFVHISSLGIYKVVGAKAKSTITEDNSPLEADPLKRGFYSFSKAESERIVQEYMREKKLPVVIIRPGTIYGPKGPLIFPRIGYSLGNKLILMIGSGKNTVPLVFIDNLVDSVIAAIQNDKAVGQVMNIVDDEKVTQIEYVKALKKLVPKPYHHLSIPYCLIFSVVNFFEGLARLCHKRPPLTKYSLRSSCKNVIFDNTKAHEILGWKSRVSFKEGIEKTVNWHIESN